MDDDLDDIESLDYSDDMDDLDVYEDNSDPVIDALENNIGAFLDAASVDAVYGLPVEHGDTLIIPAAEVLAVLGFGAGGGGDAEQGRGAGAGGGGRVFSRPAAVVISTPDGVRVEPVYDWTKILMACVAALAFILGMNRNFSKMRRAIERPS